MVNKKIFLVIGFVLLFVNSVFALQQLNFTQQTNEKSDLSKVFGSDIRIRDIRQDPFPANPGEYVDVYMRIDNFGSLINNPRFELVLPYPFSLDSSNNNAQFTSIAPGDKVTLHYRIKVDKNAVPDDYEVLFKLIASDGTNYPYYFNIKINDVTSSFDSALQDVSKEGLSLVISNTGKNTANSITVRLDNQTDFDLLGPSSFIIGNLNAGDYTILNSFIAPKNGVKEGDMLNLRLDIDYTDITGNRRTVSKIISVLMTHKVNSGFSDLKNFILYGIDKNTTSSGSNFFKYTTVILFVVLVIVLLFFRKKHKRKE